MFQRLLYYLLNVWGLHGLLFVFDSWSWRLHGARTIIFFTNWVYDAGWKVRLWWRQLSFQVCRFPDRACSWSYLICAREEVLEVVSS